MTNYEYYNKNGISFNTVNNEYLAFCNKNKKNISFDKWIHSERKFEQKFNPGDIVGSDGETFVVMGFNNSTGDYYCIDMNCLVDFVSYCNRHSNDNISTNLSNFNLSYSTYVYDFKQDDIECCIGSVWYEANEILKVIYEEYLTVR